MINLSLYECRINFVVYDYFCNICSRYGQIKIQTQLEIALLMKPRRRPLVVKRICFICYKIRSSENDSYNEGGIGRCEMTSAQKRLNERTEYYLSNTTDRFHDAANRFNILNSGQSFDSFAIDIYYHKSCYIKYAINPPTSLPSTHENNNQTADDVMNDFYRTIRIQIIKNKEAYLLHHLHQYLKILCEEYGIGAIYEHSVSLKRDLLAKFTDQIDFFPCGKYVIVHSSNINPCEYSIAVLKGKGMQDKDYVRTFGNFIHKKISKQNSGALPETTEELIQSFGNGPLPELYNIIYATMYSTDYKVNEYGYAITNSNNIATKIWSIASDWQSLITRKESPKKAMLGLTLHRLTGSKEAIMNLNKFGHTISYNKVREYNDTWSKSVSPVHERFVNCVSLHSSIDNNDGRQETLTGCGTTHDTNMTLFQTIQPGKLF